MLSVITNTDKHSHRHTNPHNTKRLKSHQNYFELKRCLSIILMRTAEKGHEEGEMERKWGIKTSEGKNSSQTDVLSQRKEEKE